MSDEERKRYQRERARRVRAEQLAAAMRTATRCPKRFGPTTCGGPLATDIDKLTGRTVVYCVWCDRTARRICLECAAPVAGKSPLSRRCAVHRDLAVRRSVRASVERHAEKIRAHARAYYQSDPEIRAKRNEYKRQYRLLHPDKVRAQKRRHYERHKEKIMRKLRRYERRYAPHIDEIKRARYEQLHPRSIPACRKCGKSTRWTPLPGVGSKPWELCTPCLHWPHLIKERRRVRARHRQESAAWLAAQPKTIKRPLGRKVAPTGQRLCLGAGCDVVLTGRKKKCRRCRERDAQHAAQLLAAHAGRGRRTDLERRSA